MAPFSLFLLSTLVASTVAVPAAWSSSSRKSSPQRHAFDSLKYASSSTYQCFDGAETDLSPQTWLTLPHLWRINEATVLSKNGGDTYIKHYIHEAILQVADESAVDARIILALMMQESSGRASIPCKVQTNGSSKCGLMQTPDGSSFDETRPRASVLQMTRDGIEGASGDRTLDGDKKYLSDVANRLLGWDGQGAGFAQCAS